MGNFHQKCGFSDNPHIAFIAWLGQCKRAVKEYKNIDAINVCSIARCALLNMWAELGRFAIPM